jgi:hypothetical protein
VTAAAALARENEPVPPVHAQLGTGCLQGAGQDSRRRIYRRAAAVSRSTLSCNTQQRAPS